MVHRIVHSNGRLSKPGSDEVQLPLVVYNVARCKYARNAGGHKRIHKNAILLDLQPPRLNWA